MADTNSTFFDSSISQFQLANANANMQLISTIKSISGLPGTYKVNDVTTFGSTGVRPGPSIFDVTFRCEFLFNRITNTGSWTVLNDMYSSKASRSFLYYPAGSGNTACVNANAYLTSLDVTSRIGEAVTVTAEFKCDNFNSNCITY